MAMERNCGKLIDNSPFARLGSARRVDQRFGKFRQFSLVFAHQGIISSHPRPRKTILWQAAHAHDL